MKLLIPDAIILCSAAPERDFESKALVTMARVQYMGGEIRVANPNKLAGAAKDVEIEVRIETNAKGYKAKDTGQVGGFVSLEVRAVKLLAAKLAK